MTTVTYPGVYIEEIPSGVRTITGVSTSTTAFVGRAVKGPVETPTEIHSFGEYDSLFGGLADLSPMSFAVQQYFGNGGQTAVIVRVVGAGASRAQFAISGSAGSLALEASSEGLWGNNLRIEVDAVNVSTPGLFNIIVTDPAPPNGTGKGGSETLRNLSADSTSPRFITPILAQQSQFLRVASLTAPYTAVGTRNTASTLNGAITAAATTLDVQTGDGARFPTPPFDIRIEAETLRVTAKAADALTVTRGVSGTTAAAHASGTPVRLVALPPITTDVAASTLNGAITAAATTLNVRTGDGARFPTPPFDIRIETETLRVTAKAADAFTVTRGVSGTTAAAHASGTPVQMATAGADGAPVADSDVDDAAGPTGKHGMYALEDRDIFNLLVIPPLAAGTDVSDTTLAHAAAYCRDRRAFLIVDPPDAATTPPATTAGVGFDALAATLSPGSLDAQYAGYFFPRFRAINPLTRVPQAFAPSGAIAGIFARTDASRGVWKAPAGLEAGLNGILELVYNVTDGENGTLNQVGVNCLRTFNLMGSVVWGSRTVQGSDALASDWKYIPVRRLALYIEESLFRGTQWVVFEPNDEPLWAQIRLAIGAFMQNLFRQGAFQGRTPREAYFVKCDGESTTQNDINLGIVNILVGFAPLKPAEFVIIKIQQMAGQVQA